MVLSSPTASSHRTSRQVLNIFLPFVHALTTVFFVFIAQVRESALSKKKSKGVFDGVIMPDYLDLLVNPSLIDIIGGREALKLWFPPTEWEMNEVVRFEEAKIRNRDLSTKGKSGSE